MSPATMVQAQLSLQKQHLSSGMRLTVLLLAFFIIGESISAFAQAEDQSPISVLDIKTGLTNLDYIRTVLLERGFKLQSKEREGNHLHEYWFVPSPECPTICSLATFQINQNTDKNMTFCSFSYTVKKSERPEYYAAMKRDATANFPLKKVQEVTRTTKAPGSNTKETKEDYDLTYYSNDNKITVSLEDNGNWAGCSYSLTTFSKVPTTKKTVGRSIRRK